MMIEPIWIHIPGRPIPKPRMTRKDKWNPSASVIRYRGYASRVIEAYLKNRLEIGKFDEKRKVSMGFTFTIAGGTGDLDNWIKGVKDALVGYALSDDRIKVVPSYFKAEAGYVDCNLCADAYSKDWEKLKRPRCKMRECPKQESKVGFKEIRP